MRILTKIVCIGLASGLLHACSGGGGEPSGSTALTSNANSNSNGNTNNGNNINSAPTVSISAPEANSMASTNELIVRGTASDADGVSSIEVNGLPASSSDEFANWSVQIPLREGMNEVTVSASDTLGNRNPQAATVRVERGYLFDKAVSVVMDTRRDRAVLIESSSSALMVVDSATQMRKEFSGNNMGSGPRLVRPEKLFLDAENDRVLVFDSGRSAVLAVELDEGVRTELASDDTGSGPTLNNVSVVAVNPEISRLYALNNTQLINVDLNSGNRSSVNLSGADISDPRSARVDSVNNRLLVSAANNIFAVNIATGVRSPLIGSN